MSRTRQSRDGNVARPRQTATGIWSCRVRWFDAAGRHALATEHGPTAVDAQRRAEKRLDQELRAAVAGRAGLGPMPVDAVPTFSLFALVVAREVLPQRQRPEEQIRTLTRLARWVEPHLGGLPMTAITTGHIRAVLAHVRSAGRSRATANRVLAAMSVVFESAVEREMLTRNPCRARGLRSAEGDRAPQFLTPAEARRLLEHADPEWRDFFAAAIYTGLRFGELVALRWSDVDLEHGVLYVRRSHDDAPKSGHHRVVPMADELRAHWPAPRPGSHLVFPRRGVRGGVVDPVRDRIVAPRKALQRALDQARIDKPIRFHDLRHTFGTLLTRSGANLRTVQAVMGHSTLRMTQRYAHLADDPALSVRGFSLQADKPSKT